MQLKPEQEEYLRTQFLPKLKPCSLCGSTRWGLQDRVWEIREFEAKNIGGPNVIPCVCLTCQDCGQMHFLNSIVLGLAKSNIANTADTADTADMAEKVAHEPTKDPA